MKIKVSVNVSEYASYSSSDIAACTLEVEHVGTTPRALRAAVEALNGDAVERVIDQLRAVEKTRQENEDSE